MNTSSIETERSGAQVSGGGATGPAESGCCGGAAPRGVDACCALDAEVKSTGGSGCGCGAKAAAPAPRKTGCC